MAPKPPPSNDTLTLTLLSGQPSRRAISSRTKDGIWVAVCSVMPPSRRIGHGHEWLEGGVKRRRAAERMFEHMIRAAEPGFYVSAAQLEIERDVGVPAAGQMLEIGECAGRPELVMHDGRRGHSLDLVEHGRQFFVLARR